MELLFCSNFLLGSSLGIFVLHSKPSDKSQLGLLWMIKLAGLMTRLLLVCHFIWICNFFNYVWKGKIWQERGVHYNSCLSLIMDCTVLTLIELSAQSSWAYITKSPNFTPLPNMSKLNLLYYKKVLGVGCFRSTTSFTFTL